MISREELKTKWGRNSMAEYHPFKLTMLGSIPTAPTNLIMKQKPTIIWAAAINLSGPWAYEPIRMKYDPELKSWYDKSGNLSVSKIGLHYQNNITTFSSENERDVGLWLSGVKTLGHHIRNYCWE